MNTLLPHGYCLQWNPSLLWTMVIADLVIALTYFSIPLALWFFARRRPDIRQRWLIVLFGLFVMSCGITHLMDVWNVWLPNYWPNALARVVTAGFSLATAIILWVIMPLALRVPSIEAMDAARSSLERMAQYSRSLLEASLDPLVTISPGGKITDVNAATELVTGLQRAELIGTDFCDYFTDPANAKAVYEQVLTEGCVNNYPLAIRRIDGHVTEVLYNASVYRDAQGTIIGVFAAARDITELLRAQALAEDAQRVAMAKENLEKTIAEADRSRKAMLSLLEDQHIAQAALKEREEQLKSIGDNVPNGYVYQYLMRPDGTEGFSYISAGIKEINGLEPEDVLRDASLVFAQITPESMRVYADKAKHAKESLSTFFCDVEFLNVHGETRWARLQSAPHRLEDGTLVWDGIALDITTQRESEARLEKTVGLLHLALEGGQEALWEWNLNSGAAMFSKEFYTMLGYAPDEFTPNQEEWHSRIHPDDKERVLQQIREEAARGGQHFVVEYRLMAKDGRYRWIMGRGKASGFDKLGRVSHIVGTNVDITERRTAAEKIAMAAQRSQALLDLYVQAPGMDEETLLRTAMNQAERLTSSKIGYAHFVNDDQETITLGTWSDNTLSQCAAQHDSHYPMSSAGVWADCFRQKAPVIHNDYQALITKKGLPDGHAELLRHMSVPVMENDQVRLIIGVGNKEEPYEEDDLRELQLIATNLWGMLQRKRNERKLALDAEVFRHSREGIVITDAESRIITVNDAFREITGYDEDELIGQTPRILKSGRHDRDFYRAMWKSLLHNGFWQGELWNRRKNGETYPELLHITAVRDNAGEVINYIGVFSDVSNSRALRDRVTELTRFDPITGLPNLFFFDSLLSHAIEQAEREKHRIAVLRIDMENFHSIDDTFGFEAGDQLLKIIAERLQSTVGTEGIITRLGKDNFTIACPHVNDVTHATQLAQRLQLAVNAEVDLGEHEIHPGVNIGISFFPNDGRSPKELVQRAGVALNHAKSDKLAFMSFFEQEMNDILLTKIALTNDIRRAIEREEFELYYQPQIDLASGKVVGLEALVRWNHPVQGFLPPSEFIMLAEESGLILPLGDWILKRAMNQMKEWLDSGITGLSVVVAVNASALQMESGDIVDFIEQQLKETGLPAHSIELELTESLLMSNVGDIQKLLQRLKALGVRLSIDDFGTGYSSLSYLKQFDVDKLKIDKSFIDHVTTDPNDAVIVQATIAMARSLNLRVIAEGVETEAQASYLRTLQCDEIQGYFFSRPIPASEVMNVIRQNLSIANRPSSDIKRRLLLVDDEVNVISSLKRILRREGYEILTATSGEEGLDMLAKHDIGVIVSDQRMPVMTGVEFLSRVKVMYPRTVRIILSGYTEVNTITEAVNKGEVFKFLTKPWEDDALLETIREAFIHYENTAYNRRATDRAQGDAA